jgi:hypothetical protein
MNTAPKTRKPKAQQPKSRQTMTEAELDLLGDLYDRWNALDAEVSGDGDHPDFGRFYETTDKLAELLCLPLQTDASEIAEIALGILNDE